MGIEEAAVPILKLARVYSLLGAFCVQARENHLLEQIDFHMAVGLPHSAGYLLAPQNPTTLASLKLQKVEACIKVPFQHLRIL